MMYVCVRVYACIYVCMNVFMHVYTYVCMYVYASCVCIIHTCYVLIDPPIPSSRCKHFVFLRPIFFYFTRELTQGPPLVTTFRFFF